MPRRLTLVLVSALLALSPSPTALAQTPSGTPASDAGEVPPVNYRIKKISLTVQGGYFSGGTYFELPTPGPRTQEQTGSTVVVDFNGTEHEPPSWLTAPRKEIESGSFIGGTAAFYLSEDFHLDLRLSVAKSTAVLTFLFRDDPNNIRRDELIRSGFRSRDEGFRALTAGGALHYDANAIKLFGITPSIGCGFGGIINRFSFLEDKTALYFQMTAGLSYTLTKSLRLDAQATATTFSFATEELHYSKQVTYTYASAGLTYLIDMIPGD